MMFRYLFHFNIIFAVALVLIENVACNPPSSEAAFVEFQERMDEFYARTSEYRDIISFMLEWIRGISDMYYWLTVKTQFKEQEILLEQLDSYVKEFLNRGQDAFLLVLKSFKESQFYKDNHFLRNWVDRNPPSRLGELTLDNLNVRESNYFLQLIQFFVHKEASAPGLDPGATLKAYIDGRGFCSIFKHPSDPTSDIDKHSLEQVDFAQFGYLIRTITSRLGIDPGFLYRFRQLSLMCESMSYFPLDDKDRKKIMNSVMSWETKIRLHGDIPFLCYLFIRQTESSTNDFDIRIPKLESKVILIEECLSEFTASIRQKFESLDTWQVYDGSLVSRWLNQLIWFVDQSFKLDNNAINHYNMITSRRNIKNLLNPQKNTKLNLFLKALVAQVPADKANETFKTGHGLCDILKEERLREALEASRKIISLLRRRNYELKGYYVQDILERDFTLISFEYFRTTCSNLRRGANISWQKKILKSFWQVSILQH